MYLKSIGLKRFRSFEDASIDLQKDLTIFVGENNSGKSNAIDAIRLLTSPLGSQREKYCESTDLRFQSTERQFEIVGYLSELSAGQQGRLITAATGPSLEEARFGLTYAADQPYAKPHFWAGKDGNIPERGSLEMIRHVYLPPLRDANYSLASSNPTRILALLKHFLEGTDELDLAKELARNDSHPILKKVDGAVGKNLSALTTGVRHQDAALGFSADETLVDIARDLRFRLADYGVTPESLRYSGLGYANLLYMSIIAVELEKVRTADLTLFLVEEPEAHLHPQLQAAVLGFLMDQAEASRKQTAVEKGPAGELQVIVATHSPNLSAWVSSEKLVVFKSVGFESNLACDEIDNKSSASVFSEFLTAKDSNTVKSAENSNEETTSSSVPASTKLFSGAEQTKLRRRTNCIALALLDLKEVERRKVDRYLDVTKAALLFASRVLIVEGIAEALLLPVIAQHHTLKNQIENLRIFRSAVFIAIDGVDFEPYAKLLLTSVNGARIADRLVIVTDGDKDLTEKDAHKKDPKSSSNKAAEATLLNIANTDCADLKSPGQLREEALVKLARELNSESNLSVITNEYSLEPDLLKAGNEEIMKKAYLKLHKQSQEKWNKAVSSPVEERGKNIKALFKEARKGDYAQILAGLIEQEESFIVPAYIEQAIKDLVK